MSEYGDYDSAKGQPSKSSVILLMDIDAFEWQVYTRGKYGRKRNYDGHPGVIVNSSQKILAVSKPAKELGVTRNMNLNNAYGICPQLKVYQKPNAYGKPEGKPCRRASQDIKSLIYQIIQPMRGVKIEAYTDEIYIDLTDQVSALIQNGANLNSLVDDVTDSNRRLILESRARSTAQQIKYRIDQVYSHQDPNRPNRYADEIRLLHGSCIAGIILNAISQHLKYIGSVGVSHNRLTAKLACNKNKPNSITVLTLAGINRVSRSIRIQDIPTLGGNLGWNVRREFEIYTMYQLSLVPFSDLAKSHTYVTCVRLFNLSHGMSNEAVINRKYSETMSTALTFNNGAGRRAPSNLAQLLEWFGPQYLSGDLAEKLNEEFEDNHRIPRIIKVSINKRMVGNDINLENLSLHPLGAVDIFNRVRGILEANGLPRRERISEIRLTVPQFNQRG